MTPVLESVEAWRRRLQAPRLNWPIIFALSAWFQKLYSFQCKKIPFEIWLTLWNYDVRMLWVRAFDQRSRILNVFLAPRACRISWSLQKHAFTVSLGHARVCLIKCVSLLVELSRSSEREQVSNIAADCTWFEMCSTVQCSACMLSAFFCFTLVCFIRVWWTKHCAHKKRHKFHKFAQIIYALLLRFWYCRELCVFPGSELHKLLAARLRIVILHTQKIYTNDTVLNSKIWLTKRGIPSTIQTSQPWRKIEKMRDIFTPAVSIYFLRLGQATLCYWQEPGLTAKEPRPTKEPRPK